MDNVLNKDPPMAPTFGFTGSTYTNPSLFDIYGRRFTLGVKVSY